MKDNKKRSERALNTFITTCVYARRDGTKLGDIRKALDNEDYPDLIVALIEVEANGPQTTKGRSK